MFIGLYYGWNPSKMAADWRRCVCWPTKARASNRRRQEKQKSFKLCKLNADDACQTHMRPKEISRRITNLIRRGNVCLRNVVQTPSRPSRRLIQLPDDILLDDHKARRQCTRQVIAKDAPLASCDGRRPSVCKGIGLLANKFKKVAAMANGIRRTSHRPTQHVRFGPRRLFLVTFIRPLANPGHAQ